MPSVFFSEAVAPPSDPECPPPLPALCGLLPPSMLPVLLPPWRRTLLLPLPDARTGGTAAAAAAPVKSQEDRGLRRGWAFWLWL